MNGAIKFAESRFPRVYLIDVVPVGDPDKDCSYLKYNGEWECSSPPVNSQMSRQGTMGAEMTNGQRLYEHRHPRFITLYTRRVFGEPVEVPNPVHIVPWRLLTEQCRETYEREAQTHWLFQERKEL